MNYAIKKSIMHPVMTWVLLLGMLLLNHCSCLMLPPRNEPLAKDSSDEEVVLFLGKRRVGKDTLCNSIFQESVFTINNNMKEEHIYKNIQYITTPELKNKIIRIENDTQAMEMVTRSAVATTIAMSLKKDKKYKIIFVIDPASCMNFFGSTIGDTKQAIMINTICEAIQAPFEYGIIFNKASKDWVKNYPTAEALVKAYLSGLKKAPSAYLVIEKDADVEAGKKPYLSAESRDKLLNFISGLQASKIKYEQVQWIK